MKSCSHLPSQWSANRSIALAKQVKKAKLKLYAHHEKKTHEASITNGYDVNILSSISVGNTAKKRPTQNASIAVIHGNAKCALVIAWLLE